MPGELLLACNAGIRDKMLASSSGCKHLYADGGRHLHEDAPLSGPWHLLLDAAGSSAVRPWKPSATTRSLL